jgi:hypothetical protein
MNIGESHRCCHLPPIQKFNIASHLLCTSPHQNYASRTDPPQHLRNLRNSPLRPTALKPSTPLLDTQITPKLPIMPLPFYQIGALMGASSVMLGAFGAHGLKKRIADPARITNWSTAAQYQVHLLPPLPAFAIHKRRCVFEPCKFAIGVRTLKRCSPPIPTFRNPSSQAHAPAAHPLHRPDLHRHRRAAEHAGDGAFHSGHGHVQRLDILACVGPAEVQVPRAGHAVGGRLFDRRVGCVGGEGKAGLEEVKEEG